MASLVSFGRFVNIRFPAQKVVTEESGNTDQQ